jgi:hypothetical protein
MVFGEVHSEKTRSSNQYIPDFGILKKILENRGLIFGENLA